MKKFTPKLETIKENIVKEIESLGIKYGKTPKTVFRLQQGNIKDIIDKGFGHAYVDYLSISTRKRNKWGYIQPFNSRTIYASGSITGVEAFLKKIEKDYN